MVSPPFFSNPLRSSHACALTHPHLADIGQRHEQWFKRSVGCSCRCRRCIRPPVDCGCPRQARASLAVNCSAAKGGGGAVLPCTAAGGGRERFARCHTTLQSKHLSNTTRARHCWSLVFDGRMAFISCAVLHMVQACVRELVRHDKSNRRVD